MPVVTVHEAKTHLSRLLARVEAGEEVVIARGKVEVAKLVPMDQGTQTRRTPGRFADTLGAKNILDHGFWEPLDDADIGLDDTSRDAG
jgi:prevent-host-death family protein